MLANIGLAKGFHMPIPIFGSGKTCLHFFVILSPLFVIHLQKELINKSSMPTWQSTQSSMECTETAQRFVGKTSIGTAWRLTMRLLE
jgi:hypothetical protein